MALKGNLEDIPIGNIFQMIFLEKKAGILSVKSATQSVRIIFDGGKILQVEQSNETDENRLKLALIKNQYLTKEQWIEVKKECDRTLKPVFTVLVDYLQRDVLTFFIQRQVQSALFSLLQWNKGEYIYSQDAEINVDRNIFKPIEGEFLVMEGYRAIDEWKKIEKTLPSKNTKLNSAANLDQLLLTEGYTPTDEEKSVLSLTSETISFEDLLDSILIDVCETGKAVSNLLSLSLLNIVTVEKTKKTTSHTKTTSKVRNWKRPAIAAMILIFAAGGFFIRYLSVKNSVSYYFNEVNLIKSALAAKGLSKIGESVSHYYSLKGEPPSNIHALVIEGYLSNKEAIDPWGRPFIFKIFNNSFELFSNGPVASDPADNIYYK